MEDINSVVFPFHEQGGRHLYVSQAVKRFGAYYRAVWRTSRASSGPLQDLCVASMAKQVQGHEQAHPRDLGMESEPNYP